jgi:hypothetical protein
MPRASTRSRPGSTACLRRWARAASASRWNRSARLPMTAASNSARSVRRCGCASGPKRRCRFSSAATWTRSTRSTVRSSTVRQLDADRLNGPGVADLKGGLLVMWLALSALERSPHRDRIGWEVLFNPDEEIGSRRVGAFVGGSGQAPSSRPDLRAGLCRWQSRIGAQRQRQFRSGHQRPRRACRPQSGRRPQRNCSGVGTDHRVECPERPARRPDA